MTLGSPEMVSGLTVGLPLPLTVHWQTALQVMPAGPIVTQSREVGVIGSTWSWWQLFQSEALSW